MYKIIKLLPAYVNDFVLFTFSFIFLFLYISCSPVNTPKRIRIGFSQCTGADNWRKATVQAVKREISFHPGSELIYRNAQDNSDLQVRQIEELIRDDIDILLVSPNEAQPLTSVVEEAFNKGIPVVMIDRKTSSNLYTSFVGADNFEIGKMAGNYIANMFHDTANIIEVIGLAGSTPSSERKRGFAEGIRRNPKIRIIAQVYGNWLKEKSSEELLKIKDKLSSADLVFAHNDPMALGAYELYKKIGIEKNVRFIGVDGLPGLGGGIQFVSDKILTATLLNPTGGEEAIQIAFKILSKELYNKENTLPTVIIDSTNVRTMKLQMDKINSQQNDIENQQAILIEQQKIYKNQRTFLYILVLALSLVFFLGCIAGYSLWSNRRKNKRLATQNQEILDQKNQLIEMTAKAKEATDAKFNFFTNISHEFKTPLTLILGPLEDALNSPKLHFTVKNNLELVKKNAYRLLRLVNQLMDFRKIEHNKLKIKASENNLIEFVTEITAAFNELAIKKRISFHVTTKYKEMKVWFDVNMLDKVLFNILSNAFKFTNDHGFINVTIDKSLDNRSAIIKIEDSGVGMSQEAVEHAFDVFYQGHEGTFKGTGLGLALSKELIAIHQGKIILKSEKWKGTHFEVTLPLGNAHLKKDEILRETQSFYINYDDVKIYTTYSETTNFSPEESSKVEKEYSIVLIEDNTDMRIYLKNNLAKAYEIHESENGTEGLNLAYNIIPDLIITDIILPGKDGLDITNILKNDFRTSHIPIIILTAKGSIEKQIESLKLKADAFIVKPFNFQYLEETINSLLRNRETLKDHYTCELPNECLHSPMVKKIDRKFVNEFSAIVESNIANENFGVDDICKEIGVSRVQLYRKIKALLGCNINDYILSVRLQKAKFLLINEDLSISEVASKVGFASQAYFSNVFKSKVGTTPKAFKEK